MAYTTINKSTDYFNTKLWTGTGSSNALTGVGFQPDWTWIKNRTDGNSHVLQDAVRGVGNTIISNNSDAQAAEGAGDLTAFGSDGFTVGTNGRVNGSGKSMVAWNWKANGAGSANTDGSISSTVSANTTSGFSIVSYTGTGSAATIGHGLGVSPACIIIKNTSDSGGVDWFVYHQSTGATNRTKLNQTVASATSSFINNTTPSPTVFNTEGGGASGVNANNYIAYCFAEKQGYSKFGSYTGNGNADGTFVYTGFKPAFVMTKKTSGTSSWDMHDTKRDTFNVATKHLLAEDGGAEGSTVVLDILSNGFKFRTSNGDRNAPGETYIYMAFAEAPLVGSNNVPTTAR